MGKLREWLKRTALVPPVEGEVQTPAEEPVSLCPFCGSQNVVGTSQGTISCGFCNRSFSVYIEPVHPSMPRVMDGEPYQPAGTLPVTGEPVPAADQVSAAPGPGGGLERFRVDQAASTNAAGGGVEQFRTASGDFLGVDDYLAHLAVVHTANRERTLMQVRSRRGG